MHVTTETRETHHTSDDTCAKPDWKRRKHEQPLKPDEPATSGLNSSPAICDGVYPKSARRSACLVLASAADVTGSRAIEVAVRSVLWLDRSLEWHDSKVLDTHVSRGLGFNADELFPESSRSTQGMTDWMLTRPDVSLQQSEDGHISFIICGSAESPASEDHDAFAKLLLEHLCHGLARFGVVRAARVVVVSRAPRIPIMSLPDGVQSLSISKSPTTLESACTLLDSAGMLVIPDAVSQGDVAALRHLASARIHDMQLAMWEDIAEQDIGCGNYQFAEIVSRGKQRWDMLLHQHGECIGSRRAAADPHLPVMERLASSGVWMPMIKRVLGECTYEVGCVCSRPGATGQGWHADGVHGDQELGSGNAPALGLCVFVPLVPIQAPAWDADGTVKHGRGCTAFWPGSHRYRECPTLGAVAANQLHAAIPAAPLRAGAAVVYDLRLVHCGSPHDAFHLQGEERDRPIMQFTYFPSKSYRANMYGFYSLFE